MAVVLIIRPPFSEHIQCLVPENAVEPLQGDDEDGVGGAGEGDLSQGQEPGNQAGVNLAGK